MKIRKFIAAACLAAASFVASAESSLVFCSDISTAFKPEGVSDTFDSLTVSWLAKFDKAVGSNSVSVSLYQNVDQTQNLVARENVAVNPQWNCLGMKNAVFPEPGNYTISVDSTDGQNLAQGTVTINEPEEQQPAAAGAQPPKQ